MATTRIRIQAAPQVVWDVLMDPAAYPLWVVGTRRIRGVDPNWPAPGSTFAHAVGWGPVELRDNTRIVEVDPPGRLVIEVRVRPLVGIARVTLTLSGIDGATDLEMVETPTAGPMRHLEAVTEALIAPRYWLSLQRLRAWCEQRQLAAPAPPPS
jgi:uncharacterized protein YndB with AHSA1/START domain